MSAVATSQFVPDFGVRLGGLPAPEEIRARITGVRFEESLEGAARVELTIADPAMGLVDSPLLDLDRPLTLALGYLPAGPTGVFEGEITSSEPTFSASGSCSVVVSAQDGSRRLQGSSKERGFPFQLTDAVVAKIVAAESGLIGVPDLAASGAAALSLRERRPRVQHKQTDAAFLRSIAAEYGFDMWTEGAFLNFRQMIPFLPRPEIELRWGASLLEFAPRSSSIGQVAAVRTRVWIERVQTELAVEIGFDGERLRARVMPAAFGSGAAIASGAVLDLPGVPLDSPVEAIKVVLGELRRRLNSRVTATGSAIGDARFRVGRLVAIRGVGSRYSGDRWRLTSVAHSLGAGGYRTTFKARQEVV